MDEQTHYRYYDIKQNTCLDMIQYMKELGMELKEIKEIPVPECFEDLFPPSVHSPEDIHTSE